jgi:hypothetical protein
MLQLFPLCAVLASIAAFVSTEALKKKKKVCMEKLLFRKRKFFCCYNFFPVKKYRRNFVSKKPKLNLIFGYTVTNFFPSTSLCNWDKNSLFCSLVYIFPQLNFKKNIILLNHNKTTKKKLLFHFSVSISEFWTLHSWYLSVRYHLTWRTTLWLC